MAIAFDCRVPADYPVRGGTAGDVAGLVEAAGLRPRPIATGRPGDLLLVAAGPGQLHLIVLTDAGFVHADAGLRRVVEVPGTPASAVLGAWTGES